MLSVNTFIAPHKYMIIHVIRYKLCSTVVFKMNYTKVMQWRFMLFKWINQ